MDDNQKKEVLEKYRKQKEKKQTSKTKMVVLLVFFLCCIITGGALAYKFFMPNFTENIYYERVERGDPNEYLIVYGETPVPSQYSAIRFEDDVVVDYRFLAEYGIDPEIFWDAEENMLTITTPYKVIRMAEDERYYTVNGVNTEFPIGNTGLYCAEDGRAFLPLSFLDSFYQLDYGISDESKMVVIDSTANERQVARVKSGSAAVRYAADIKSEIAEKAAKNETVTIFAQAEDGFLKVRTEKGTVGYIKSSALGAIETIAAETRVKEVAAVPEAYRGKRFNLVWDQITGDGPNQWYATKEAGIDIASPTWFSITDEAGNIKDNGSRDYVKAASAAGYEVWPLVTNGFDAELTHATMKSTKTRQKIIDELIVLATKYGVSGINVDFESYAVEDGYYVTQFLKELGVAFRQKDLISSVDMQIPRMDNSPTDREQIGKYIDFVMVMAYDQHWASSPTAGPVAGYDWVASGIEKTLEYIPAEKVVLGLPLYTRMWYTPKSGENEGKVTSRDFSMQRVADLLKERGATMEWEENTKYERGTYEYEVDSVLNTIQAWPETVESLRAKAEMVNTYALAGSGSWKKGLEMDGVWPMLDEVVHK